MHLCVSNMAVSSIARSRLRLLSAPYKSVLCSCRAVPNEVTSAELRCLAGRETGMKLPCNQKLDSLVNVSTREVARRDEAGPDAAVVKSGARAHAHGMAHGPAVHQLSFDWLPGQ